MIKKVADHRGTTILGAVVAMLGYLLSPEFALQSGINWVEVLPAGVMPFITLAGTLIATLGPSLKKK